MENHITVIDVVVGNGAKGFAIRVGTPLPGLDRHYGCYHQSTGALYKIASNQYTYWHSIHDAINEALKLRDNSYAKYSVRVDCTL